ncbi:hypothetical protein QZH41_008540 [Actinostola sp. cb2023]|nr:hypothetical protein QZH41_008540 [Actinostola sp. cb2023]
MDRNSVKHLFILSFLIVQYVQLTKASSAGCLRNSNICEVDEYCHQGYLFGRCIKRSELQEYYYGRTPDWQQAVIRNELNSRRQHIPQWKELYRQRQYDSSEPTLEDKTLIRSLPLDEKEPHIRNAHPIKEEKLPPESTYNWDKIAIRDDISVNNGISDASIPDEHRGYNSEEVHPGIPRQTFHEDIANEQISIEHLRPPHSDMQDTNTLQEPSHGTKENPLHNSSPESSDVSSTGKVMIKGEVKKAESNIDQGPNPEKTYERIKDFFKSQQASSIVDVPNAVKREEAAKLNTNNFVQDDKTVKDQINAEEVADPKDSSERSLKIDLDRRVDKSSVRVQTVKNEYSPEDESDIAKRINEDSSVKEGVARQIGVKILKADEDTPSKYDTKSKHVYNQQPKYFLITLIAVGCVTGVILSAVTVYLIMKRYNETKKFKPVTLPGQEAAAEYEELCRQFRASQGWEGSTIKANDKEKSTLGHSKPPPYSWYFLERPCPPAIDNFDIEKSSGIEFQEVADMLSTKKKNLKKQGLGNQPNAAQPVEKEDVEKLWSSGAVGLKNPRKLIHLVWWNNVTHLGMRGVKEHYDCQIQDFTITDQYIEYNERQTKNRQGDEGCARKRARKYTNKIWRTDGGEQDPYRAFVEYVTHRPKSDDANVPDNFYLTPIDKTTSEVWYKKCPIGKNTLAKFMKTIASTAESEEPVVPNMDISTGHVVLAYMEDHLKNKDRLNKEWEVMLILYSSEPNIAELGKQDKNVRKNRYSDVLPYDHNRVILRETANATGSDYVNASFITDHDPRNPAYIATQGPLAHTVSDFWQMIWEQGVVVVVNLTRLSDLGLPQCHRYWPEEGHETYHIYEVHLVSEHIWCDDYLVRSFYLKNLQTSETRTVTQFHFLSWPDLNVPTNPKPLLEFRRKVNKCFRGRSCPIVVHCSGGVGRTGCYILIDMVLNKMMRGAKEIDIAATVEHLRDQRPHMVKTKAQFEFALTAVAEEVNAILQALSK